MLGLGLTLNFPGGPVQVPVLHPPPAGATSSSCVTSSSHDHTHNTASRPSRRERLSDLYSMKIGGEPLKEVIYLAYVGALQEPTAARVPTGFPCGTHSRGRGHLW